jgi:hypothetical protein
MKEMKIENPNKETLTQIHNENIASKNKKEKLDKVQTNKPRDNA